MSKRVFFVLCLLILPGLSVFSQIKVACIGNSITYGSTLPNRTTENYPLQLGTILGGRWAVSNFGVSGATLLKKGDRPYTNQSAYTNAINSNPNVVVIKLGTNDSKTANWVYKSEYVADYKSLLDALKALPSKPIIFICFPIPAISLNFTISNTAILQEMIPMIRTIASDNQVELIDLYTPFLNHPEWYFTDGIHPSAAGARKIAELVSQALLANPILNPTGVDDVEVSGIRIYPNPVKDKVFINIGSFLSSAAIDIYSSDGVLQESMMVRKKVNEIDMRKYKAGMYQVRILSAKKTSQFKLLKL